MAKLQSEMESVQDSARQRLVDLASEGEKAVSVAQAQLVNAHQQINQFHALVKVRMMV